MKDLSKILEGFKRKGELFKGKGYEPYVEDALEGLRRELISIVTTSIYSPEIRIESAEQKKLFENLAILALIYPMVGDPQIVKENMRQNFAAAIISKNGLEALKCLNFDRILDYVLEWPTCEKVAKQYFSKNREKLKIICASDDFILDFLKILKWPNDLYDEETGKLNRSNICSYLIPKSLFLGAFRNVAGKKLIAQR